MSISIVFYTPEGTSLANAAVARRLDTHFEGKEVSVYKGKRTTPCVLATITDTASEAYGSTVET